MPSYEDLTADLFDGSKSSFRRVDALEKLRTSDHPMAIGAILQVVDDEDKNIRRKAASVLASFRDPRCMDALGQLVSDEDERVRENAVRSLAETGDPDAEPFITKGLSDDSWLVRRASRDAMERLKTRVAEEQTKAAEPTSVETEEIPDVSEVLAQAETPEQEGPPEAAATGDEGTMIVEPESVGGAEESDIPSISEFAEEPLPRESRAWCAIHPENEAIGICERCGNFICPECRETVDEKFYCSTCFETAAPRTGYTPWENRHELGFINALWETTKQVLFSPSEFYRKMPISGGIGEPLIFAIIFCVIGGAVQAFWQFGVQLVMGAAGVAMGGRAGANPFFIFAPAAGSSLFVLVCAPFAGIAGIFISSAILHLCTMIVRARKYPIEATFRIVCYAMATQAVAIIPFCGGAGAGVWALVVEIIGIKEAHETTVGKAVLAVFLPMIFLCGLAIIMIPIVFGILFASGAFN